MTQTQPKSAKKITILTTHKRKLILQKGSVFY
jgi:hypothetical protein